MELGGDGVRCKSYNMWFKIEEKFSKPATDKKRLHNIQQKCIIMRKIHLHKML
jgi:hypothetical protein